MCSSHRSWIWTHLLILGPDIRPRNIELHLNGSLITFKLQFSITYHWNCDRNFSIFAQSPLNLLGIVPLSLLLAPGSLGLSLIQSSRDSYGSLNKVCDGCHRHLVLVNFPLLIGLSCSGSVSGLGSSFCSPSAVALVVQDVALIAAPEATSFTMSMPARGLFVSPSNRCAGQMATHLSNCLLISNQTPYKFDTATLAPLYYA
jgi:hypothetical protein